MIKFTSIASTIMGAVLRVSIRIYQNIASPLLPATCRYWPSCSEYAAQAIARHGPATGGWFALKRIGRCHPWGGWGYDPVPEQAASGPCQHHHTKRGNDNGHVIAPVSGWQS